MKGNLRFELLTTDLMVYTIDYKTQYDKIKKEFKKALQDIEDGYKPGPLKDEKIKGVSDSFNKQFTDLRLAYADKCTKDIETVRELERDKISVISETKLAKLKAISDIPLTAEEMAALIDTYKFSDDYWCERYIKTIAEKNGFDASSTMEADFATKMSVLDQLQQQSEEMLKYYDGMDQRDGELRQKTVYLNHSNAVMENAMKIWYGECNVISDEELANKAFLTVRSKQTDVEKGIAMSNVLRNAKGEARNELLFALATDNSISQFAYQLSGFNEELVAFRSGKARAYAEAKEVIKEAEKFTDSEIARAFLNSHSNNEFVLGLAKSSAQKNNVFKTFVAEAKTE